MLCEQCTLWFGKMVRERHRLFPSTLGYHRVQRAAQGAGAGLIYSEYGYKAAHMQAIQNWSRDRNVQLCRAECVSLRVYASFQGQHTEHVLYEGALGCLPAVLT